MNYRPILYTTLIAAGIAGSAGCATKGEVRQLRETLSNVKRDVGTIDNRVAQIETRPLAEEPIMLVQGRGYDKMLGMVLGVVLPRYQDSDSRKVAEKNANAVYLIPTGDRNAYNVVVMRDVNDDGLPTLGIDRTYVDNAGGRIKEAFRVNKRELPREVLDWLGNSAKTIKVQPKK